MSDLADRLQDSIDLLANNPHDEALQAFHAKAVEAVERQREAARLLARFYYDQGRLRDSARRLTEMMNS